ncbi:MAG: hypothetical protein ACOC0R_03965 [Mariniphaga sp.]
MKTALISVFIISSVLTSCVSVPRETVTLSKVLHNDLITLHNSHRQLAALYFRQIKDDVNSFVDDVYSPFVIHYVLNVEMQRYRAGEASLFRSIENAAAIEGLPQSEEALNTMLEFQQAAHTQIQLMREELLVPVEEQERQVTEAINRSYEQAIRANHTITGYLESVRKVRESQQQVLTLAGFQGADSIMTGSLLRVSELVNAAVKKGKQIDVRSDEALLKIEEVSNQIKNLTQ